MPKLSKLSQERLDTCHPLLQKVVKEAIKTFDFSVACGYRGEQEQNEAYARGFSQKKFPDSRHNSKPSQAVDLVPYPLDWKNIESFKAMAIAVKAAAAKVGVTIEWGGDWRKFKDYPHFQLPAGTK